MKRPVKKKYNNEITMTKNMKDVFREIYNIEVRLYKSNCVIALLTVATLLLSVVSFYFHFLSRFI